MAIIMVLLGVAIGRLSTSKDALERERSQNFRAGMASINEHLARIYRQLTEDQGAASCSFADDPALLFLDGITFNVRCDRTRCARPQLMRAAGVR